MKGEHAGGVTTWFFRAPVRPAGGAICKEECLLPEIRKEGVVKIHCEQVSVNPG